MKFRNIIGNPPYKGNLHLEFLEKMLGCSDKISFIQPAAFLLAEESKNNAYRKAIDSIENHVYYVKLNYFRNWFDVNIGGEIAIILIDKTKTFDEVEVDYVKANKNIKLKTIRDINTFCNDPVYESFKKKILSYCINNKTLKDVLEKKTEKKYSIQIEDMAKYCVFGAYKQKGKEYRKVEIDKVMTGVSFDDKEMADAVFSYLKDPITILALHISKKNWHVHPSAHTLPWFSKKEDFLNPGKALGLTKEEVKFCHEVKENHSKYFVF